MATCERGLGGGLEGEITFAAPDPGESECLGKPARNTFPIFPSPMTRRGRTPAQNMNILEKQLQNPVNPGLSPWRGGAK